jgi:hypothetical protein
MALLGQPYPGDGEELLPPTPARQKSQTCSAMSAADSPVGVTNA